MQSDSINELATALSKAQGKMESAKKDSINPFFKSKYADLASTWEACRSVLSENGLSVVQTTSASDGKSVTVVTTLMHSSGQWIKGELTMIPSKADPQGVGSCLKYARRYALGAIVGIAESDDDGEQSVDRKSAQLPNHAPLKDPGEYVMPAGKFAGVKVKDISEQELNSYIEYQIHQSTVKGKPLSVEMKRFIECADEYLNNLKKDSPNG